MTTLLQTDPPRPARETLPTMYDLPSEEIGMPGMPDEYHAHQAILLSETFCPPALSPDEIFSAIDLNLYYDVRHPKWYKRPDWFAVVGVPRLYEGRESRLSYVVWQEGIVPLLIVELLSPGTEKEDLGQTLREAASPPTKWEAYERILRVPYYVLFGRLAAELQVFKLNGTRYAEDTGHGGRIWLPEIELGLGVWDGRYHGQDRLWLRWFDAQGHCIPTLAERAEHERQRAEHERQRAEHERQRAERMAELLRQLGHDPDKL